MHEKAKAPPRKLPKIKPIRATNYDVDSAGPLLDFLFAKMPENSRSKVKSLLSSQQVLVNGQMLSQFDHALIAGDRVTIRRERGVYEKDAEKTKPAHKDQTQTNLTGNLKMSGIRILFEDNDLLVIDKPAGLLSISPEKKERTAYTILSDYWKLQSSKNHLFVLHRLDRHTSGVMMFAKSKATQDKLQRNWTEMVTERNYMVLVEGVMATENGTIRSWLKENKARMMYSVPTADGDGQEAVTHWKIIQRGRDCTLVEAQLETGRKNQIRVHMKDLGHNVVGDLKYGAHTDPLKRLGLHAQTLAFIHPGTEQKMRFESPLPPIFLQDLG